MSTANKRMVISNEDDDAKVSVTQRGLTKAAMAVEILDSSGNQVTSFGDSAHSTVGNGEVTVVTAGVAVQLSSTSVPCKRVWIQHDEDGGGRVSVGDSNVTTDGRRLYYSQGDWFYVSNLNLLYINSTVSGDTVAYYYEN